ncbi:MAG: replication-associated recombination protein A [Leptospiraceae bacterium]|nr:replication-associated recombination protein A [Leptospiraceae bacterium]MCP5510693.1 replication-associated recombination protein A [Leptospiraceae bacterium]
MSENLFRGEEPLASELRPKDFSSLFGQEKAIETLSRLKKPISLLLYGPPGTGKTTVARIMSQIWKLPFRNLNAVSSGVKEIKELISETDRLGRVLLFLDEIHRFSSSQQDSLLDAVETGRIVLIGATTENPAFRINKALISRCSLLKFFELKKGDFLKIYERAKSMRTVPELDPDCFRYLIDISNGDARQFLNGLEILSSIEPMEEKFVLDEIKEIFSSNVLRYDRNGEDHYDTISAFIKSIRGSDPDAALLYLAILLESGEDPLFIMRRLAILASEDVGNASVYGVQLAASTFSLLEKIGMPEGRILLSQLTVFLASCPKSNASYLGIDSALDFVRKNQSSLKIPLKLRNAPTSIHKKEGNARDYRYPHNYQEAFLQENYFPEDLQVNPPQFYFPEDRGHEKTLKDRLKHLWKGFVGKEYSESGEHR